MERIPADQLNETFLCRLSKTRVPTDAGSLNALKTALLHDLNIDDETFAAVLSTAQSEKIIAVHQDKKPILTIKDEKSTGVQRLIRKFCKRYYGEVSPLIERKTIQAVLKRHGANFDLDAPEVRAELQVLEDEGLIRVIDRGDSFLKLLGAE